MERVFTLSILLLMLAIQLSWAQIPQTMSYQGVLTDAGGTVVGDGPYSLTFRLYGVDTGGAALWSETQSVAVVNGVFNVMLGSVNPLTLGFDQQYWLGITVGADTELTPRTQLTSAPYSLNAQSVADDAVTGDTIADGYVVRSLNGMTDDITLLEGANITITPGGNTLTISAAFNGWSLTGNAGTTSANFLGTIDDRPLELRVNNAGALRLEPNGASPNVIGGFAGNSVTSGVYGAAIGGGGESGKVNSVTGHYGTVGGGVGNTASGAYATVPGGYLNEALGSSSFAAGHKAKANHDSCFVWGDSNNIDFASTDSNQFLIRAAGGVGIGTASPTEELDVAGDIHASGTIQSGNSITVDGASHRINSDQTLDVRVNNYRALRLEPNSTSPNLIGGFSGNSANSGVYGATIGGGGSGSAENVVTDNYGTVGGGTNNQAGNAGQVPDDAQYATVGGGTINTASGSRATVGGGGGNTASGSRATVGGGTRNTASGSETTVGGGLDNTASGSTATIGGGYSNEASGFYATVGGGLDNTASARYATIAGGGRSDFADHSTHNRVTDDNGTIGGGGNNQAGDDAGATDDATYATVGGGEGNTASVTYATIGGGKGNIASGRGAAIGGGNSNEASDYYATIGGGLDNTASAQYATIAGGGRSDFADPSTGNRVTSDYGTVGGGGNNQAGEINGAIDGATYATVGGGGDNTASGWCATVGGGKGNAASGWCATVPGGFANEASGNYSFAAGWNAKAEHGGSFVWGDVSGLSEIATTGNNQFIVRAGGGIWFGANSSPSIGGAQFINTSTGAYLTRTGIWTNNSDGNAKENFAPIDREKILSKLAQIPISRWNYRIQDPGIEHIGPTAQDFYAAFSLGEDEKHISTLDAEGLALAAIQGLYELAKEKDAKIAELEARLRALEASMSSRGR